MSVGSETRRSLRISLASASPRRKALLSACGYQVHVQIPDVDEAARPGEAPRELVLRLARAKAATIAGDELVVAADTTVVVDGRSLAKPADDAEAAAMLRSLAGRSHEVLTGFCVRRGARERADVVITSVRFRPLTDDEIAAYVKTGEPLDKAGAYGIQGQGGALVDAVFGSYTNVVGLPLAEVVAAIGELA